MSIGTEQVLLSTSFSDKFCIYPGLSPLRTYKIDSITNVLTDKEHKQHTDMMHTWTATPLKDAQNENNDNTLNDKVNINLKNSHILFSEWLIKCHDDRELFPLCFLSHWEEGYEMDEVWAMVLTAVSYLDHNVSHVCMLTSVTVYLTKWDEEPLTFIT